MIVDDLDLGWSLRSPHEADPVPVVDANTVHRDSLDAAQVLDLAR
jgi:hypothetical protein